MHARAADAPRSVTFQFEDNRIYVPVSLAGGAPHWFILDTGASPTIVDAALAREAGLQTFGDDVVTGAGAGSSHQRSARNVSLTVGDVPLKIEQAAVSDLAGLLGPTSGRAPAGIVGSQFFREHVVELDFHDARMIVHAPDAELAPQFDTIIPLSFSDAVPMVDLRLTLPSGKSQRCHAVVDLGAKSTLLLPEPYIERTHLRSAFAHTVTSGLGAGMGGDTRYAFARAKQLAFDAHPDVALRNPIVALSVDGTLRSGWHEGLLGAEFLAHYRLAFDYARSRLLLSMVSSDVAPFDMSGLFLVAGGAHFDHIEVGEVLANGPGARAGLRVGDRIERVDDRATNEIGLAGMRTMFKSGVGKEFALAVRRGDEQMVIVLRLDKLL